MEFIASALISLFFRISHQTDEISPYSTSMVD